MRIAGPPPKRPRGRIARSAGESHPPGRGIVPCARCAAAFCTALLVVPSITYAQGCFTGPGVSLIATASYIEHAQPVDMDGSGFGGRVEWSPSTAVVTRASYRRDDVSGQAVRTASAGGALRLPVPARPCVTLDLLVSSGASLDPGDHFRNATVPLGIVFAHPLRWGGIVLTPSVGGHAIFSTTDARLLSFDLERQSWGYGALGAARLETGRILTEVILQTSSLRSTVGPQPLGRLRAELSLGFRL